MKHEFEINDDQKDQMLTLINAMTAITGGKAEIVTRLAIITEDERIIAAMNSLVKQSNVKGQAPHAGKAAKVWTIDETGEMLGQAALSKRLSDRRIAEGTALFHEERGNHVVDKNDRGNLTLRRIA